MVSPVDDPGLPLHGHENDYWQLFAREQSLQLKIERKCQGAIPDRDIPSTDSTGNIA